MTDESIPRPLIVLGEEFRLMAEELSLRMDETPFETGTVYNIARVVAWQEVIPVRVGSRPS